MTPSGVISRALARLARLASGPQGPGRPTLVAAMLICGAGHRFLACQRRRQSVPPNSWNSPVQVILGHYTSDTRPLAQICAILSSQGETNSCEPSLGKGNHGRVWFATVSTILKDPKKELGTGLLRAMRRELGIDLRDL
jgi:hypothetical protein